MGLESELCAWPTDPSKTLGGGDPVIFMLKRALSNRLALSSQKAFMPPRVMEAVEVPDEVPPVTQGEEVPDDTAEVGASSASPVAAGIGAEVWLPKSGQERTGDKLRAPES